MGRFTKIIAIAMTVLLFTTGCWDRIEIDNRAFVVMMGLDLYDPEKSTSGERHKPPKNEENRYKITYVLPRFAAIKEAPSSEQQSGAIVLQTVAKSAYRGTRELTARMDSRPFFQHMKAFVFGIGVVENEQYFMEVLDGLERNTDISSKIHIFVTNEQSNDILSVKSTLKPLEYKLQGMGQAYRGTPMYIPKTLEEVINDVLAGDAVIPRIQASDTEVKVAGSAVIKEKKFFAWLEEEETRAVAFLTNNVKKAILEVDYNGINIPYMVERARTKKSAKIEDGKIVIDIMISTKGDIQQYIVGKEPRLTDVDFLKELEEIIEKQIKDEAERIINKVQKEMEVDIIGIGDHLKRYEPKIWKQVEHDWREVYPTVDINVKVTSSITDIGTVK
ncbi:spore germination protein, Ger(X)C family [Gottschalkia acidurici 9a]|uniref:Spore germination protein, Ger(X)C family n=1 Tax=Gottschalkia acidurici (strain ATCC 7906 / DSM 604 / BCRC 14475 / CIP 104303 / KCTC 5404 / NCIMB 10678 / 9a) TaxID=1128398 RepID=K0AWT3_GOTA9|nr:Ger(x)C family spore germination protein [Gottschalkia acidurici]AFS77237.1 spore germination protein, Ger(X)C family [Gottschalkia acidurici 9a]